MNIITKTSQANNETYSLRTTIPKEVVGFLELSKGDNLIWVIDEDKNSVCIKKLNL